MKIKTEGCEYMQREGIMGVNHSKNAVLYTDGGYRQNLSIGGWGVHGYTYDVTSDKFTAHPKVTITAKGYLDKNTDQTPVLVKTTIDGFGSLNDKSDTNNTAELTALSKALTWVKDNHIEKAHIKMDSQYALNGFTKSLETWKDNGWRTKELKPLANQGQWRTLADIKEDLKGKVKIKFEWVKGHSGDIGNSIADELATKAMKLGLEKPIEDWDEKAYTATKVKPTKSRLLSQPQWFFSAISDRVTYKDYKTYYLGFTGKRIKGSSIVNLVGKPINEARLSIVYLKEPDPSLEIIETQMRQLAKGQFHGICVGDLNNILKPDNYNELQKHGSDMLIQDTNRLRLMFNSTDIACEEITPARLVYSWVDEFNIYENYLKTHLEDGASKFIETHDITDKLFDVVSKVGKKKTTYKTILKPDITVGIKTLDFKIDILNGGKKRSCNIRCQLGQDLPDRNTLAAVADSNTKVYLLVLKESDNAIRFVSVLHCKEGICLYCGPYSNLVLYK